MFSLGWYGMTVVHAESGVDPEMKQSWSFFAMKLVQAQKLRLETSGHRVIIVITRIIGIMENRMETTIMVYFIFLLS